MDTIFKRKSIRKFNQNPLGNNVLDEIKEFLDNLEPLFPEIKTEFKLVSSDDLRLLIMRKAPHYIAIFSEKSANSLINVGYMFQQFDLFLSSKGLGSCWQGIPRAKKQLLESSDLEYIIVIAFGEAKEKVHRDDLREFKRKRLDEITEIEDSYGILELARFAPSSRNRQPWYFTGSDDLMDVHCLEKLLNGRFSRKMTLIDIGIVVYYVKIAANGINKDISVFNKETNNLKGYSYIFSLEIK